MVLEKEATSSTLNIPLGIEELILLNLPVKSLLRFKAVCKSWNNIISDYEFAKNHLQQSKINSRNQNIFLWKRSILECGREHRLIKFENYKFQTIQENPHLGKELLCYADGLALLGTFNYPPSYLLWNPSTKQESTISGHRDIYNRHETIFGFFRGPTLDDYKIVVARCSENYIVYSCKYQSWTKKKEFPYNANLESRQGGVFVDGLSFWVMREMSNFDSTKEIFYFDPRYETFKKLQKPIKIDSSNEFYLTSLKGYLCLYDENIYEDSLRIWILRDNNVDDSSNSWSQLMIINYDAVHGLDQRCWIWITPLFFTEKNELVIRSTYEDNKIGIYNSKESKFHEIDHPASFSFFKFSVTIQCLDSLFFPKQHT